METRKINGYDIPLNVIKTIRKHSYDKALEDVKEMISKCSYKGGGWVNRKELEEELKRGKEDE